MWYRKTLYCNLVRNIYLFNPKPPRTTLYFVKCGLASGIDSNGNVLDINIPSTKFKNADKTNYDIQREVANYKGNVTMDFSDYKRAFSAKSRTDLIRSLIVMTMCTSEFFVNNSMQITERARQVLGRPLVDAVIKRTAYRQFVGGCSEAEIASCTCQIQGAGVGVMFAVPIEDDVKHVSRDEWYNESLKVITESMRLAQKYSGEVSMIQLRITALVPAGILTRLSEQYPEPSSDPELIQQLADSMIHGTKGKWEEILSEQENEDFRKGLQRLSDIGQSSLRMDVRVWVDAEYTFVNPAINMLSLAMALNCNRDKPLLAYTYQNYLKTTYEVLCRDIKFCRSKNVQFSAKLVRGAYIVKERLLSKTKGYPDPIHDTLEATSEMYERSMYRVFQEIARDPSATSVILATHNEDTLLKSITAMSLLGIDKRHVMFGQLYGMCDHVSYSLGQSGYLVFKSIPFGNIDQTLPYLSRRAQENRAVLAGLRRERQFVWKALMHRLYL